MNITQLKYVLAIAGSSSMREASTKLFVSQPALSASVRDLEDELGILIFDRTNKGIALTDQGREFVEYAKKAVGQYAVLEDRYLSGNGDKDRFSVSSQHYNFAIRAFMAVVRRMDPERYVFSFRETKTKEVLDDVGALRSEVGIVSFSAAGEDLLKKLIRDNRLQFVPLMRRDTYAYVWKDHPLAGEKTVSLEDLRTYPCISFDQSSDAGFYLPEEAMADYAFEKSIKSDDRATSMELIAGLNGYSIGCGMLSEEDAVLKGLVSIKLREEDPLTIGFITRKDCVLSLYGRAYVEELEKYKEIQ